MWYIVGGTAERGAGSGEVRPTRDRAGGGVAPRGRHWCGRKETSVRSSEHSLRLAVAAVLLGGLVLAAVWGIGSGMAEEEQAVGRYQAGAPDLILDTATGKLARASGQVLEPAIDPSATEVGRYSVAGWVSAVTRSVGLDVIQRPVAATDLVKGYVIVDTKTGHVVKQKTYHSSPLQAGEL